MEVFYVGRIDINTVLDYGARFRKEKQFPKNLNMLVDATEADYAISRNDFPRIINALKKDLKNYDLVRVAFIQNKPRETAYSILYGQTAALSNYVHKVFSTREGALEWLGV